MCKIKYMLVKGNEMEYTRGVDVVSSQCYVLVNIWTGLLLDFVLYILLINIYIAGLLVMIIKNTLNLILLNWIT